LGLRGVVVWDHPEFEKYEPNIGYFQPNTGSCGMNPIPFTLELVPVPFSENTKIDGSTLEKRTGLSG
jgi:hypothetical protein